MCAPPTPSLAAVLVPVPGSPIRASGRSRDHRRTQDQCPSRDTRTLPPGQLVEADPDARLTQLARCPSRHHRPPRAKTRRCGAEQAQDGSARHEIVAVPWRWARTSAAAGGWAPAAVRRPGWPSDGCLHCAHGYRCLLPRRWLDLKVERRAHTDVDRTADRIASGSLRWSRRTQPSFGPRYGSTRGTSVYDCHHEGTRLDAR